MSKKNKPFVGYTSEEIFASEARLYFVQVGEEILEAEGQCLFMKKNATSYYNKILREILNQFYNGSTAQRNKAASLLLNFKISPLRVH